jgi:hypothetical protein
MTSPLIPDKGPDIDPPVRSSVLIKSLRRSEAEIVSLRKELEEARAACKWHVEHTTENVLAWADNLGEQEKTAKSARDKALEEAAIVAVALKPEGGGKLVDERRNHAHAIAAAIRALKDNQP